MPDSPERYVARVVDVPEEGIRLAPAPGTAPPQEPTEVNLLGMAVALALGTADYEHHPEPRNPELQTVDALLAGDAVMPWRATREVAGTDPYVVCERSASGHYHCRVQHRPEDDPA
ncbi:hypothetical protein [Streptomyces fuscigenes]|uniref:hypothetical protein n=1 Tax=Streptomyces fuscigenes TaxID=1528880 RepID=UPI001F2FC43F|nr:hypothetical protein [Streptomyces fuscigenes]MCF3963103.1 hypothetical protein [Streptomyces fuscigenes]